MAWTRGGATARPCTGGISNLLSGTMRATSGRCAISWSNAGSAVIFNEFTIQNDLKSTFLLARNAWSDRCELDAIARRLLVTCSPCVFQFRVVENRATEALCFINTHTGAEPELALAAAVPSLAAASAPDRLLTVTLGDDGDAVSPHPQSARLTANSRHRRRNGFVPEELPRRRFEMDIFKLQSRVWRTGTLDDGIDGCGAGHHRVPSQFTTVRCGYR
jgi:hypothetical protein